MIITLYKIETFKRYVDSQKHSPQLKLETIDGKENQDNSIRE